jgi:uncharacterized lipoprotein YehR (DUF1307 family)
MRKKGLLFVIAIVTVVMLTLTGCGSKQGDNSEGGDANAGGETKIVLKLADHLLFQESNIYQIRSYFASISRSLYSTGSSFWTSLIVSYKSNRD